MREFLLFILCVTRCAMIVGLLFLRHIDLPIMDGSNMFEHVFASSEICKIKQKLSKKEFETNDLGCRLWVGVTNSEGYGRMRVTMTDVDGEKFSKTVRVSRLGLFLHLDGSPLPDDMHCSHLCHNKLCFLGDHLSLETHQMNQERKRCSDEKHCYGHQGFPNCIF